MIYRPSPEEIITNDIVERMRSREQGGLNYVIVKEIDSNPKLREAVIPFLYSEDSQITFLDDEMFLNDFRGLQVVGSAYVRVNNKIPYIEAFSIDSSNIETSNSDRLRDAKIRYNANPYSNEPRLKPITNDSKRKLSFSGIVKAIFGK
ncbi:MAG: hypothetical protein Q7S74_02730 [Nanoarchaeota archaeon]|nr:hypothetical protein [Nanoarchaeota archaeon]